MGLWADRMAPTLPSSAPCRCSVGRTWGFWAGSAQPLAVAGRCWGVPTRSRTGGPKKHSEDWRLDVACHQTSGQVGTELGSSQTFSVMSPSHGFRHDSVITTVVSSRINSPSRIHRRLLRVLRRSANGASPLRSKTMDDGSGTTDTLTIRADPLNPIPPV